MTTIERTKSGAIFAYGAATCLLYLAAGLTYALWKTVRP